MSTSEDVTVAKVMEGYILKCYRCHDPNFNLETVREGVVHADPAAMERLEVECQGSAYFVVSIFQE